MGNARAPERGARTQPILLVDDRPENLRALEAVLTPLGFPLLTATSGTQALRLLLEHDFAVILLDVRMPVMDGLETAQLIKRRERTREIPIIFLTAAQDDVESVARAYEAGGVDYVLKPFDPDLLRSKVAIFAELHESRRALQRSEELLRGAFDSSPTGITVLDSERRIVRANPTFARLLRRTTKELDGVDVIELCNPDDRDTLAAELSGVAEGRAGVGTAENVGVDLRLHSGGGEDAWVALIASVIDAAEQAEPLLLCQWVDLSVRRRAEQTRAELLLEHSARRHAESAAERLGKLQALTDALGSLSLSALLDELALRIADLFNAEAAEVRVGEGAGEIDVRAAGGRVLDGQEEPPGSGSWVQARMRIDRSAVGIVAVRMAQERMMAPAEQSLLHDAADRAALAIRQAQLFEEEHRIAAELQRGLLPKRLPSVAGLRVAAHNQAAGVRAQVGGDWYDVFAMTAGRLGVVVGDVAGSGIAAASTMGQLRAVTRALALQDEQRRTPGEVVTRLNRYQLALGEDQFVTVVYAIVDPYSATVSWANAGHLPPLLAAGTGRYLSGGGYPLGTEDIEYATLDERLAERDVLIVYTDGLVERRGESIDAGLTRLVAAVQAGPRDPQDLCGHVLEQLLPAAKLSDDVTAVLIELTGPPASGDT